MHWFIVCTLFCCLFLSFLLTVTAKELLTVRGFALPDFGNHYVRILEYPTDVPSSTKKTLFFTDMQNTLIFTVNLHLNKNLFTENYVFYDPSLRWRDNSLPQQNCYYHGNVQHYYDSFVAISNCYGFHGMIIIHEDTQKFSLHTLEDGKTFVLRLEKTPSPFNGFPNFASNSSKPFNPLYSYELKPRSRFPTLRTPLPSSRFPNAPIPRKIEKKNPGLSHQSPNQNFIQSSPNGHASQSSPSPPQQPPISSNTYRKPKSQSSNVDPNVAIKNANYPAFNPSAGVTNHQTPSYSNFNPGHIRNPPPPKQHPPTYTGNPPYAQDQSHRPSYDSHFPAPSHVDNSRPSSGAPFAKNFPVDYHAQSQRSEPLFSDISTVLELLNIVNNHSSQRSSNKNRERPNVSYGRQSSSFSASHGPSNSPSKYHHQMHGGRVLPKRHPDNLKQPLQKLRSSSKRHSKPYLKKRNTYGPHRTPYPVIYYYRVFIGLKLDAQLSNPKFGEHLIGDYINLAQYYYQRHSFHGYQIKLSGAHLLPLNVVSSFLDINKKEEDEIMLDEWRKYGLRNSFLSQSDVAYLFTVDQRDVFPIEDEGATFVDGIGFIGECVPETSFALGTINPYGPHNLYFNVFALVHEIGHTLGIKHALNDTLAYYDGSVMSTVGGMFWKWKPYAKKSLESLRCHPRSYQYGSF